MTARRRAKSVLGRLVHRLLVVVGGLAPTMVFFLVLPLMQAIGKPPETDTLVRAVEGGKLEAPPHVEEQPKEEPEKEEKPPELKEPTQLLNLEQLALALNPGFNDAGVGGELAAVSLTSITKGPGGDSEAFFAMADLDQKPRVIYQPSPGVTAKVREKAPGTVWIIFIVDRNGRVERPMVQSSSDAAFEAPALAAVKQWKFEPGKRNGQAVRFRMRVSIRFPKGL